MRRPRSAVLALLALLLVVASYLTTRQASPVGSDEGPAARSEPDAAASPNPLGAAPELAAGRAERRETVPPAAVRRRDWGGRHVRVRARLDGAPLTDARVRILDPFSRWHGADETAVDERGEAILTLREGFLDVDDRGAVRIQVVATSPSGFADAAIVSPLVGDDTDPIDVAVAFRAAALVTGRILSPDGTPIGASVQAFVHADPPYAGTRPVADGVVAANDGTFRLPVDAGGPAFIVGARAGASPTPAPVTLVRGSSVSVGDIRLERGAALSGRVRCRGVPASRTKIIATWYGPTPGAPRAAFHGGIEFDGARARWTQFEAQPDDEGRFRIDGLEPGPYRLRVPTEDWSQPLHPDAYAEVDRIVRAPDEGIVVDADRSLLTIEVADGGEHVGWPWCVVEGRDSIALDGEATGRAQVVLRAGARHRLRVGARGYRPTVLEVTAAGAGEARVETVTLVRAEPGEGDRPPPPARENAVIRARVLGPDGMPLAVPFRLLDAQGDDLSAFARDVREGAVVTSAHRTGVGTFTAFGPAEGTPARGVLEVGGGAVETKRLEFDAATEETATWPATVVVLHAR